MTEVATKPVRANPTARAQARPAPVRRPPRRVSGPAARPVAPRQQRREPLRARLLGFLSALPEHSLLDRLVRGRVWIPLLGVMLGGIVAMQVELLKLNSTTGRSIELASALQSRNQILRAEVAADSAPGRIERLGLRMGMLMPGPEAITFLRARSTSSARAAASIRSPDIGAFEAALQATMSGTVGSMPLLAPPASQSTTSAASPPSTSSPATTSTTSTAGAPSTATTSAAPATTATSPAAPPPTVP